MKSIAALLLCLSSDLSQVPSNRGFVPKEGFVPKKLLPTAASSAAPCEPVPACAVPFDPLLFGEPPESVPIAEAVLIPVYGKEVIDSECPFKAVLKSNIWTILSEMPVIGRYQ